MSLDDLAMALTVGKHTLTTVKLASVTIDGDWVHLFATLPKMTSIRSVAVRKLGFSVSYLTDPLKMFRNRSAVEDPQTDMQEAQSSLKTSSWSYIFDVPRGREDRQAEDKLRQYLCGQGIGFQFYEFEQGAPLPFNEIDDDDDDD